MRTVQGTQAEMLQLQSCLERLASAALATIAGVGVGVLFVLLVLRRLLTDGWP